APSLRETNLAHAPGQACRARRIRDYCSSGRRLRLAKRGWQEIRRFFGCGIAKVIRQLTLFLGRTIVQPLTQFLAGAEEGRALFFDGDGLTSAWIATLPCRTHLDRKRAEAAQLDAMTRRQSFGDLVQHGRDDPLYVAMVEMRIACGKTCNQL